jgi:hypothetical protein
MRLPPLCDPARRRTDSDFALGFLNGSSTRTFFMLAKKVTSLPQKELRLADLKIEVWLQK